MIHMIAFDGISASQGIAIGNALVYRHDTCTVQHQLCQSEEEVQSEVLLYQKASELVSQNLEHLALNTTRAEENDILEAHLLMVSDPEFSKSVVATIKEQRYKAAWAVESVSEVMIMQLQATGDALFKERIADIHDIALSLIAHMGGGTGNVGVVALDKPSIVVADMLLPSEILSMNKAKVLGICLETGGKTSHVAILAHSEGIPCVLGLVNIGESCHNGDEVGLDAISGRVYINPNPEILDHLERKKAKAEAHARILHEEAVLPAITTDNHRLLLKGNVQGMDGVHDSLESGAEGIGLFRSEFLLMQDQDFMDDKSEAEVYRSAIEAFSGKGAVTIRTLDVGGDKVVQGLGIDEANPILGWRAVRFCLERKDIFRSQLRAILRSSVYGKVQIMFPMISGAEELDDVLAFFSLVKDECRKEGIPFDEDMKVGTMIEVPSAAICADILAKKVDFFSVGTNDLIQYTIAVDRGNEKIAYLYQPLHPGVLRLLEMVVSKGHEAGIPVGMCGEMAGEAEFIPLLVGLGFDELSMSPLSLLEARRVIRAVSYADCQTLAAKVLAMDSYRDIASYLKEWNHGKTRDNE